MDAGIWTQILTVIAMEIQIPAFAAVISDGYHVSKLPETTIMNRIMSFGVTRVYFITLILHHYMEFYFLLLELSPWVYYAFWQITENIRRAGV